MNRRTHGTLFLACLVIASLLAAACGKSVGETIDDATITTRVKTSLINEPNLNAASIDVDTFKGVVTLSGRVQTADQEQRAVALARRVSGVTDVKSTLQVMP